MNQSRTESRPKIFSINNSNTKCYFNENKLIQWSGNNELKLKSTRKKMAEIVLDQNTGFSIAKNDQPDKHYLFLLNLRGRNIQIQLEITSEQDLQFCIKYLGAYGYGYGLQSITQNFEKVGQGNFASVFKFISIFNTVKAMKSFEKIKLERENFRLSFHNEVSIMRQLKSPYLAGLDCVFQTNKNLYLQMEFFQQTLKSYLKKPLNGKKQKSIMKNLLEALKALKENLVIHRDIKPDNIMVRRYPTGQEEFVIIDFGLAARLNGNPQILKKRCGTPGFIAPQIVNMNDKTLITQKCDMFSLGATFFYMQLLLKNSLTKKKPFSAANQKQMLSKNKRMILQDYLFSYISQKQSDLVRKMIERDPNKRISVEDALNHCYFNEQIDDNDLISEQNCDLGTKLKEIKIMNTSFMSQGMILLYSLFKLAGEKDTKKEDMTKCYGETEFFEIQSGGEIIDSYSDQIDK